MSVSFVDLVVKALLFYKNSLDRTFSHFTSQQEAEKLKEMILDKEVDEFKDWLIQKEPGTVVGFVLSLFNTDEFTIDDIPLTSWITIQDTLRVAIQDWDM